MTARSESLLDLDVLTRLFFTSANRMPNEVAEWILGVRFSAEDQARLHELGEKANEGQLTPEEEVEIDSLLRAGNLLTILHSKARQILCRPLKIN